MPVEINIVQSTEKTIFSGEAIWPGEKYQEQQLLETTMKQTNAENMIFLSINYSRAAERTTLGVIRDPPQKWPEYPVRSSPKETR